MASPTNSAPEEYLKIVVVGHVDHGKSTLLGRLYADTGSLPDGKLEKVQAICRQQGKEFEYAFLFDAFLEEQEQGITIDTARTFFSWRNREYILIDAPGHKEFLKNMISGAARAEAALLLIDAHEGVQEQSKRHGYLLSLLGVKQVAVVVNKLDLVGYRREVYERIEAEYRAFLTDIGVVPQRFIPVSAKFGDNVVQRSEHMEWYTGPTVLEALGLFGTEESRERQPLRLPVQDIYKFDARRIVTGRVEAGTVGVGDQVVFWPSQKTAKVKTIEGFNVDPPATSVPAGRSSGLTLDEQVFVERGEILSHPDQPPQIATMFRSNLFWMGNRPLSPGRRYLLRLATREVPCEIASIERIIDASDLESRPETKEVARNEVGAVTIRTKSPVALDLYRDFEATGRFVLVDEYDIAGGGIVTEVVPDQQSTLRERARQRDLAWVAGDVRPEERAEYYGHRAALVVLAGKDHEAISSLARRLEQRLVSEGRHAYLLFADNVRRGVDADLRGTERQELVRRFGEVARLLLDAGSLVIVTSDGFELIDYQPLVALVHPSPALVVRVGQEVGDGSPDADLALDALTDASSIDAAAAAVSGELARREILGELSDDRYGLLNPNYSI